MTQCTSPYRALRFLVSSAGLLFGFVCSTGAQNALKFSGLGYFDYTYTLDAPTAEDVGENGFVFRRLFFVADYQPSAKFSGKLRLEANEQSLNIAGRIAPFLKDFYLDVHDLLGQGHDLRIGLQQPPVYDRGTVFWGYRSLEKTLMDLFGISASRDVGIMFQGPLAAGTWHYRVMIGNNATGRPETDRFKRIYAQAAWLPDDTKMAVFGADYAGYANNRRGLNLNGFFGYRASVVRVGVEGFYNRFTQDGVATETRRGQSAFAIFDLSGNWRLVTRADRVKRTLPNQQDVKETYLLIGVDHHPHEQVSIMPNVFVRDTDATTATVMGRITLYFKF